MAAPTPDPATEGDKPAADTSPGGTDEMRKRYLDALERKHANSGTGTASGSGEPGVKKPGGTGPAKSQRTFRRKSGG